MVDDVNKNALLYPFRAGSVSKNYVFSITQLVRLQRVENAPRKKQTKYFHFDRYHSFHEMIPEIITCLITLS